MLIYIVSGCDSSKYATNCSLCDKFTLVCFPNSSPILTPNGTAICPYNCANTYFTSCDNEIQCSICKDPLCVSCIGSICLQCNLNANITQTGTCGCLEGFAYNSTTMMCESCHSSCYTCISPGDARKCLECNGDLYLIPDLTNVVFQGTCVENCPKGFTSGDNVICFMKCAEYCKTCLKPNDPFACLACRNGFYLLGSNSGSCVQTVQLEQLYPQISQSVIIVIALVDLVLRDWIANLVSLALILLLILILYIKDT